MSQMNPEQQSVKLKTKPRLEENCETVLIGCKGTLELKREVEQCASFLGISYSEFLRSIITDCVRKMKGIR